MDWIYQPYTAKIKPYANRPDLVTVKWFFCRPGAVPLPFRTVFGSLAYSAPEIKGDATPGEVQGTLKTIPAPGPVTRSEGKKPYGPAAYFLGEAPGPDGTLRTALGEAVPCLKQPRGWVFGGTSRKSGRPLKGSWRIGGSSVRARYPWRFGLGGWLLGGSSARTTRSARTGLGGWLIGGYSLGRGLHSRAGLGGWLLGGSSAKEETPTRAGLGGWLIGGYSLTGGTVSRAGLGGWLFGGYSSKQETTIQTGLGGWLFGGYSSAEVDMPYTGEFRWMFSDTAPPGWLKCDGSTFSSATYPLLATLLGDTFGTHSGTTYHLPDARGRSLLAAGTGSGLTARTKGQYAGAESVQLTAAESGVPSHVHPSSTNIGFAVNFGVGSGAGNFNAGNVWGSAANTGASAAAGAASAHENMPPWFCVANLYIFAL